MKANPAPQISVHPLISAEQMEKILSSRRSISSEEAYRQMAEHELFHDEVADRYFKVTRNGVFGLNLGIELVLVSSAQEARRFHLWEASPMAFLERLYLQNLSG